MTARNALHFAAIAALFAAAGCSERDPVDADLEPVCVPAAVAGQRAVEDRPR